MPVASAIPMQASMRHSLKAIGLFLLFIFGFSSIFYCLIIHTGKVESGFGYYVTGVMWCPALSALITTQMLRRPISGLAWQWGKPGYQLLSYFVPLIYTFFAYLLIWVTGWGGFYNHDFVDTMAKSFGWTRFSPVITIPLYFIFSALWGLPFSVANALGEEIGWRGFFVPELYKVTGYAQTSLLVGLTWAVWHFPIIIFSDYRSGAPLWYGLTCFTVLLVSMSFILTWFRIRSNSLWTGVLLHSSHNLFVQNFFTPMTRDTGHTNYFTDEFGAVLPAICLIIAIYFWSRRHELQKYP